MSLVAKKADAEWKVEMLTQGNKHIADFLIKFEGLVTKVNIDKNTYHFPVEEKCQKVRR